MCTNTTTGAERRTTPMNAGNVIACIVGGGFVSVLLCQFAYMMISPQKWAKSRYSLKSDEITEENLGSRWGQVWFRIVGLVGTAVIALCVLLFVSHLR
jgi:hypothetical protein